MKLYTPGRGTDALDRKILGRIAHLWEKGRREKEKCLDWLLEAGGAQHGTQRETLVAGNL